MDRSIQLYVYDNDYGLPSFDVECTKSILYTRIAKVPVTVKLINSIKTCTLYTGPTLIDGKTVLKNFSDITKHLKGIGFNPDSGFTPKQISEFYAMESLVTTKLNPILQFIMWVDFRNCEDFTAPWYMKALSFPLNHFHVRRCKAAATDMIEALYPNENIESVREILRKQASSTLSTLSTRLGTSNYFFGESPSTLDVLVYSYLAPLVKLPLKSTEISSLITMWPNLLSFLKRIDARYFQDLSTSAKYLKKQEKLTQNDDELSYVALFLLFTSASTLMICFALNKGVIRLSS